MLNKKIELNILVEHTKDGRALPKTILWDDGRRFDIDKILDIRQAASVLSINILKKIIPKNNPELAVFLPQAWYKGSYTVPVQSLPGIQPAVITSLLSICLLISSTTLS